MKIAMSIHIQFNGAARQVTGSKHLLTVGDRHILLDCGMFQGPRRLANKLNAHLPFDARSIDAVVLSHAHIDHSGSLPRLTRLGYRGPIYCTPATRDLLDILLRDSAHLQASDARYLRKRGHAFKPPYDAEDVERTLGLVETVPYHEERELFPGIRSTFLDAGHILGSAQVFLELDDGEESLRLAFTGDCGRKGLPILRDPDPLPPCDVLITESTYGDRRHPSREETAKQIEDLLGEGFGRRGRVLIPAFSVGRTQNILWFLGKLIHRGTLDPLQIHLDSPLSTKATRIVDRHRDLYDEETAAILESGRNPFFFPGVRCTKDVEDSKALNRLHSGIIISASGMCEGGRILHHLEQSLARPEDCILIVGYQAQGTLGRKLLEGFEHVSVYGVRHGVRCQVRHINGLSAHADQRELLDHLAPLVPAAPRVFVVHGEENASARFADELRTLGFEDVEVPLHKERFRLSSRGSPGPPASSEGRVQTGPLSGTTP